MTMLMRSRWMAIKYDSDGNQLWVARYDGPTSSGDDDAWAMAVDGSGNVYVTGDSEGENTNWDYATIKYDSDGNQLWVARYDGPASYTDITYALAVDGSGNVYVTGYSDGGNTDADYATVKYDSDGNQLWVARYDGPASGDDYANALAVDGYDSDGNQLWVARYDGPDSDYDNEDEPTALAVDGSGNVYVTGYSETWDTWDDYATIKYDSDGNQLWVARYDGPISDDDYATALAVDNSGNVYVTGESAVEFEIEGHTYITNYTTIKYDSDGNQLWLARSDTPTSVYMEPYAMAVDGSGNVYVTGESWFLPAVGGYTCDWVTIKYVQTGGSTPTPIPPTVTTNPANNIYASSATLNGHLDNLGTASTVGVYFEWATDDYYTSNGNTYNNETTPPSFMTSTGSVASFLIGLLPATTYHYRAKAVGDSTAYGGDVFFTTTGVSTDGDGVPDTVEDNAPNGGDGNSDGTPDSQQGNVASFPNAEDEGYVTLESPALTSLQNVAAVPENALPTQGKPTNIDFPFGFFAFDITGLASGEEIELTLTLANSVAIGTQYWKYGPTAAVPTGEWYQIEMGDNDGDNVITITLKDGELGDDDLTANGVIIDQGGPGQGPVGSATGVPVFPTWYIGIAAALGAGIIAYVLRRRVIGRKTEGI